MKPMAIHDTQTAEAEGATLLAAVESKVGFIPNIFGVLATSTPALAAFVDLNGHFEDASLSPAERELVQLTASAENRCSYCVAGHSTFARHQELDETVIAAVRNDAPIPDPRLDALVRFTRSLVQGNGHGCHDDLERLLAAGYTSEQALEVILGIVVKTMSNLASNAFGIPLDAAFAECEWTPRQRPETEAAHVA